jgi:hypothetical protein
MPPLWQYVSRAEKPATGDRCMWHVGGRQQRASVEADARTRTGDPFITSEVLYQLSYVGNRPTVAVLGSSFRARMALRQGLSS